MKSDVPILAQERRAIALLARSTHTTIARVQQIFLSEYSKLAAGAHIKAFLPLLVGNRVSAILRGRRPVPERAAETENIASAERATESD